MGTHHPRHVSHADRRSWRAALAVIVPAGLITLAGLVWLWPDAPTTTGPVDAPQRVQGVVTSIERVACSDEVDAGGEPGAGEGGEAAPNGCGTAFVRLTSGDADQENQEITAPLPNGLGAPELAEGDEVELIYQPEIPSGEPYSIVDHQRGDQLWLLLAAFALAVIAFGRWRGVTALAGLAVTFGLLLLFVIPAILAGEPPLLVAIVGAAAIMLTVLYLTHGLATSTSVAVLGTLASLVLTGVLSWVAVKATHLTGVSDEQSTYLGSIHQLNLQGLLLAGILIGSLGVLDDVTITQAATVRELARAKPRYGFGQLYRAATRVGRSHIASVINTIILAYAGASLPLLIIITADSQPLSQVLTAPIIAQELVRSAVGTLGLIAAVPITTALAAYSVHRAHRTAGESPLG